MLLSVLAVGVGITILLGGENEFSSPAFTGPKNFVEWTQIPAFVVWGCVYLFYGSLLIVSVGKTVAIHVLRAGMIVYGFFGISFTSSLLSSPDASGIFVVLFVVLFALHALLADYLAEHGWIRESP